MDDLGNKNSLIKMELDEANSIKNKTSIKGLDSPFPTCVVGSNLLIEFSFMMLLKKWIFLL